MSNTLDLLIHQVRPFKENKLVDIGIKDNIIVLIQDQIHGDAVAEINGNKRLIIPGFVDTHMHLDKAFMGGDEVWGCQTLWDSIHLASDIMQKGWHEDEIYQRGLKAAKLAVMNGTTALWTHVDVSSNTKVEGIKAITRVKKEMQDYVTIQIVAFGGQGFARSEDANEGLLRESLEIGADVLGIFANADKTPIPYYDMAFA
ncbi:MAG: amidohydrolase family protein, partial [Candidatus Heimdallarchaeota archaeon]|nr:amidohydrolase family protein [Candidatus Heimdallarchaeota archaeon]